MRSGTIYIYAAGRVAYQVDSVGCPAVKAVEYDAALGAGVSNG